MMDIVFPNKNEQKLIEMAERLGYDGLCLIYRKKKSIDDLKKTTKLNLYSGTLYPEKSSFTVARSSSENRNLIENSRIDIIVGLEGSKRHDFIHHRNSGLNQVLCKLAHEKNIAVGFDFSSLLGRPGSTRARVLGRMMQNARLCRKYKVRTVIASFASDPYKMRALSDLVSFGTLLGMNPGEAKKAMNSFSY